MYSRYGDHSKRPVRLPEHYGGSAFSPSQQLPTEPITVPKREQHRQFPRENIGEKASPIADRLLRAEAAEETTIDIPPETFDVDTPERTAEQVDETEEKPSTSPVEKRTGIPPINFEGLRHLLGGGEGDADKDRLLLLGLILLLSRTEGDSDVLLWLSLLLLCG